MWQNKWASWVDKLTIFLMGEKVVLVIGKFGELRGCGYPKKRAVGMDG